VSLTLPRIYPITDTRLSGLSHAEQVTRLIAGGATLIQVRDKHATPREFYHHAAAALKISRDHGVRLIVNDRVDIALALKADGVHLGQTDMPVEAARDLLGQNAIVGMSTHNLAQAQFATRLPVDYIAFGPIFGTYTKENPDPAVGLSILNEVRSIVGSLPLVAIGGIDFANARETLEAGADAVAIISALVAEPTQIQENMRRILWATNSSALNLSGR
jgi:thiamine-phosphate pyrophosphorylase